MHRKRKDKKEKGAHFRIKPLILSQLITDRYFLNMCIFTDSQKPSWQPSDNH